MRRLIALMIYLLPFSVFASESLVEKIEERATAAGADPKIILALITHESGDPKKGWEINPYALNIRGKGVYPASRTDAYSLILQAIIEGEKSVGIGLGQIEWKYHNQSFSHFWDALDVDTNLDRTISYYLEMKRVCRGDDWCAVGYYHNRNEDIAYVYRNKVKQRWFALQN